MRTKSIASSPDRQTANASPLGPPPTSALRRFLRDDAAPSAIEYALLVAGVGVIIIAVVYMLGTNARSSFDHADPRPPTNATSPNP